MYRRSRRSSMAVPPHTLNYYAGEGYGEGVYAGEGIFAGGDHMYPHLLAGAKVMTEEQFLARKQPKHHKKMTADQWQAYLKAHAPLNQRTRNVNYKPPKFGPPRPAHLKRRLSEWAKWLQTHAGTERTRGTMVQRRARFLQDQSDRASLGDGGYY